MTETAARVPDECPACGRRDCDGVCKEAADRQNERAMLAEISRLKARVAAQGLVVDAARAWVVDAAPGGDPWADAVRAALDALPPVDAPAPPQDEDVEPPWSDSPSDLDQARSSLDAVPAGLQPADETERQEGWLAIRTRTTADMGSHLMAAPCSSCGRPFSPTHDSGAPGPTSRHPFMPAASSPASGGEA